MRQRSANCARWHRHVNGVGAPLPLRDWLTDNGSLTVKLVARCRAFRVRKLRQGHGLCMADEAQAVALSRRIRVREREVVLECDGRPTVYAHTIVPLCANAADWPFFSALGERSLGTTLFGDPRVARGRLQFARLRPTHPLMRRAARVLGPPAVSEVYARRCLYRRRRGLLLVTELFLPAIDALGRAAAGAPSRGTGHTD